MDPKWAIWTHISHYFPFSAYMGELQKIQSIEWGLSIIFYSLLSANDKNICHLKSDYLEIP